MTDRTGDAHVEDATLGLHFLGELSPAESDAVHRHLQECAPCRERGDAVVDTVALLEMAAMAARSGSATAPAAPGTRPAPRRGSRPSARGDRTGPAGSRTRGRRRRLVRLSALLAIVLVVGGLGLSALLREPATRGRSITTEVANASTRDDRSGVTISVFLTGLDEGGTRVRATLVGLVEGKTYVLSAVTTDGAAHRVVAWRGRPGVQDVTGDLTGVTVAELSYVNVRRESAGTVVSLHLTSPAGEPSRSN
ncbi:zf-HC2 domain-containing protein [Micromonospora sp. NPDC000089]|uniref:zf-HC2 domain-containing protein n=1 Tax=unclassified Micromonospora TaxID=2617518 RepID=UPI0036C717EC